MKKLTLALTLMLLCLTMVFSLASCDIGGIGTGGGGTNDETEPGETDKPSNGDTAKPDGGENKPGTDPGEDPDKGESSAAFVGVYGNDGKTIAETIEIPYTDVFNATLAFRSKTDIRSVTIANGESVEFGKLSDEPDENGYYTLGLTFYPKRNDYLRDTQGMCVVTYSIDVTTYPGDTTSMSMMGMFKILWKAGTNADKPAEQGHFLGVGALGESVSSELSASLTDYTETGFVFNKNANILEVTNSWGLENLLTYTNEKGVTDGNGNYIVPVTVNPMGTDYTVAVNIVVKITYEVDGAEYKASFTLTAPNGSEVEKPNAEYLGFYTEAYDPDYKLDINSTLNSGSFEKVLVNEDTTFVFVFSGYVDAQYLDIEGRHMAIYSTDCETDPSKTAVFAGYTFKDVGGITASLIYKYFDYENGTYVNSSIKLDIEVYDIEGGETPDIPGEGGEVTDPEKPVDPDAHPNFVGVAAYGEQISERITASLMNPTETGFAFKGEANVIAVTNNWGNENLLFWTNEKAWVDEYNGCYVIPVTVNPIGTDGTTDVEIILTVTYEAGGKVFTAEVIIEAFAEQVPDLQVEAEFLGFYLEPYDQSYVFDEGEALYNGSADLLVNEQTSIVMVFKGYVDPQYFLIDGRKMAVNSADYQTVPGMTAVFCVCDCDTAGYYSLELSYEYFSYKENVHKTSSAKAELNILNNEGIGPDIPGEGGEVTDPDKPDGPGEVLPTSGLLGIYDEQAMGYLWEMQISNSKDTEALLAFGSQVMILSVRDSWGRELNYTECTDDIDDRGFYYSYITVPALGMDMDYDMTLTAYVRYSVNGAEYEDELQMYTGSGSTEGGGGMLPSEPSDIRFLGWYTEGNEANMTEYELSIAAGVNNRIYLVFSDEVVIGGLTVGGGASILTEEVSSEPGKYVVAFDYYPESILMDGEGTVSFAYYDKSQMYSYDFAGQLIALPEIMPAYMGNIIEGQSKPTYDAPVFYIGDKIVIKPVISVPVDITSITTNGTYIDFEQTDCYLDEELNAYVYTIELRLTDDYMTGEMNIVFNYSYMGKDSMYSPVLVPMDMMISRRMINVMECTVDGQPVGGTVMVKEAETHTVIFTLDCEAKSEMKLCDVNMGLEFKGELNGNTVIFELTGLNQENYYSFALFPLSAGGMETAPIYFFNLEFFFEEIIM